MSSSDLDEVKFIDEWNSLLLLRDCISVNVINKIEYDILKTARDDCVTISMLTLRLESVSRDAFFAGYHTVLQQLRAELEPTEDEITRSEKALYSFKRQHELFMKMRHMLDNETIKSMGLVDNIDEGSESASAPKGKCVRRGRRKSPDPSIEKAPLAAAKTLDTAANTSNYMHSAIKCVYCGAEKSMPAYNKTKFIVHPYCPMTHDQKIITMCFPC